MIGTGIKYTIITKKVWKNGGKFQLELGTNKQIEHGWITTAQDFFDSLKVSDQIQVLCTKIIPEGDGG